MPLQCRLHFAKGPHLSLLAASEQLARILVAVAKQDQRFAIIQIFKECFSDLERNLLA